MLGISAFFCFNAFVVLQKLMCFSPKISLATAIIEFLVVAYFAFVYKKSILIKLLIFFIFFLGMYQFSEFLVCSFNGWKIWGRVAFLSYNFLPVLGLHFVLRYSKINFPAWILYIPTLIFASMIFWMPEFIQRTECLEVFVIIKTVFFRDVGFEYLTWLYWIYYFGYIVVSLILTIYYSFMDQVKGRRRSYLIVALTILISLLPAYILIVFFPTYGILFPSIYCEFSLLFALAALIGVRKSKEFQKK